MLTVIELCQPADESSTITAPSRMFNVCSTCIVKSICPGVSTRLILCFFQGMVTAAEVIVIPVNNFIVNRLILRYLVYKLVGTFN